MSSDLTALQDLLAEISEHAAAAEIKGIRRIPSLDPFIDKAQNLGIEISPPVTFDGLRTAVENYSNATKSWIEWYEKWVTGGNGKARSIG